MTKEEDLVISTTGERRNDYYLVNGSTNFAVIPKGKIRGIDEDMPIRLPQGDDKKFGARHIRYKRQSWIEEVEETGCVARFLWKKLQGNGDLYAVEDERMTIHLRITPSILVILKKQQGFFSITTAYYTNRSPKQKPERKYLGRHWGGEKVNTPKEEDNE